MPFKYTSNLKATQSHVNNSSNRVGVCCLSVLNECAKRKCVIQVSLNVDFHTFYLNLPRFIYFVANFVYKFCVSFFLWCLCLHIWNILLFMWSYVPDYRWLSINWLGINSTQPRAECNKFCINWTERDNKSSITTERHHEEYIHFIDLIYSVECNCRCKYFATHGNDILYLHLNLYLQLVIYVCNRVRLYVYEGLMWTCQSEAMSRVGYTSLYHYASLSCITNIFT